MVTIRDIDRDDITGYFGNKLFQIAAAFDLAKRNNVKLVLPHFEFENDFKNDFFDVVNKSELKIENEYCEPFFHHQEIPYQPNLNLVGYFQSWKYCNDIDFLSIKDAIYDECWKRSVPGLDGLIWSDLFWPSVPHGPRGFETCSLHVRRGDYLNLSPHHPVMTIDYYKRAMDLFPNVDYFVICSNDIEWCKTQFVGKKFIFSDSKQERSQGNSSTLYDFCLLSSCDNHIIANSSFSWWAARMSHTMKVVCPKNWFGPALVHHNTKDLFPENWIKL